MSTSPEAEAALKSGDIAAALSSVKASIRREPADADLRLLLFQILAVRGDWDAAATHIRALGDLTGRQSPLPLVYHAVVQAEAARGEVFAGKRAPTVLGEPPDWLALQVQAIRHAAAGEWAAAAGCRDRVRELAGDIAGSVDGNAFDWLADADSRTEPVLEVFLRDTYYWVPQARLRKVELAKPETLRDLIWAQAEITFANGGVTHGFLPVRYPVAPDAPDACRLARTTEWAEPAPGFLVGSGQRFWTTSADRDFAVLETGSLAFDTPDEAPPPAPDGGAATPEP